MDGLDHHDAWFKNYGALSDFAVCIFFLSYAHHVNQQQMMIQYLVNEIRDLRAIQMEILNQQKQ